MKPDRIHYIDSNLLYGSKNYEIYLSNDLGKNWELVFKIPETIKKNLIIQTDLINRLFRNYISFIIPVDKGNILIFIKNTIIKYDLETKTHRKVNNPKMKKPLNICRLDSKTVIFGDYLSNKKRNPINIWITSDAGVNWSIIYNFKDIRHIHGIFKDPYTNYLWVTTGDEDSESKIWKVDLLFKNIEPVINEGQLSRAVTLLFSEDYIYYGTDTPFEKNYICRFNRTTKKIEKMQEVGSSVFWGCKVNNQLFFSTTIEPSHTNKTRYCELWSSINGIDWEKIKTFKKDLWSMRLFQYGQVFFPIGENNSRILFYTPFSTKNHMKFATNNLF
tara:strand:- start:23513 stop:24505 length:993 start_codon:yes stop_codon:yes gene_type:complete